MNFKKLKLADQDSSDRPDAREVKDGETSADETFETTTSEGYPKELDVHSSKLTQTPSSSVK